MWNKVTQTSPIFNRKVIVLCKNGTVTDAIRSKKYGWEQRVSGYSLGVEAFNGKVIGWLPYSKNVK